VKIIKKHAKFSGIVTQSAESWLSKQLFFSGSDFAELQASLESLSFGLARARLTELGDRLAPELVMDNSEGVSRCPICLDQCVDPVELSTCGHRFCWKCVVLGPIAFAPGEYRLSKCAVCRNEQPLDPTSNFKSVGSRKHLQLLAQLLQLSDVDELQGLITDEGSLEDLFGTGSGAPEPQHNAEKARQLLNEIGSDDQQNNIMALFCSLCCEPLLLEAITTTPCKHHFHRVCLQKYDQPSCPLCDAAVPIEMVTRQSSWHAPAVRHHAYDVPVYYNRYGRSIRPFAPELIEQKKALGSSFVIHNIH
jgi:hypothetical protein